MPTKKLKEYFGDHAVPYKIIEHDTPVYTTQELAAAIHLPGHQIAKTVMVKIDGKMAMAVLQAPYRVNLEALKEALGAEEVELATEKEFRSMFPDCEAGAMPPFGNLYGLDVYVSESLTEEMLIAFCGGSHKELVQISYEDFARLVKPKVLNFAWKP